MVLIQTGFTLHVNSLMKEVELIRIKKKNPAIAA